MNNIQVLKPYYRVDECLEAIRECLECGWTGPGFKTIEFEEAWKKYTRLPHAHFLNSATAGLHLAVKIFKDSYGWQDSDEIITTPLTFVSTNHAILYERLFPVFADVNPDTLCLSPASIEERITTRTKAVMYVGVGGNPGQLDEVRTLCKKRGLKLILDAAHMAGTKFVIPHPPNKGLSLRHVGSEADVTVFSFQAVKNLPTADGGMICFQDAEFDAKARKLSWLGIDKDTYLRSNQQGAYKWKYDVPEVGFKYHGNSIMAALGLVALKYLDEDNLRRNELFDIYRSRLTVDLGISPVDVIGQHTHHIMSRHLAQVVVHENRDKVLEKLNTQGIYPGVHYIDNTHYRMYRYGMNTCPVAHAMSKKLLTLPLHVGMTNKDAEYVAETLKDIVHES
ncbi:MAG: DegT/DnrJ/EryC1/StrS aminotransferase family protein [Nitrososphaerales archaeon]